MEVVAAAAKVVLVCVAVEVGKKKSRHKKYFWMLNLECNISLALQNAALAKFDEFSVPIFSILYYYHVLLKKASLSVRIKHAWLCQSIPCEVFFFLSLTDLISSIFRHTTFSRKKEEPPNSQQTAIFEPLIFVFSIGLLLLGNAGSFFPSFLFRSTTWSSFPLQARAASSPFSFLYQS